jgi:maleate isomerase
MLEHEWPHWLPDRVLFPVQRIPFVDGSEAGYRSVCAAVPEAARQLALAGSSVVAFACTVGSLFRGIAAEQQLIADMAAASSCPALSLGASSIAALRQVGARRIAILSPYSEETNRWVSDYVLANDLEVAGFIPTPVGIVTIGDFGPAAIADVAIAGMQNCQGADALWIACTAIQTMAAIARIEVMTNCAVVSGSQALLWHALTVLGLNHEVGPDAGRLFRAGDQDR